MATVEMHEYSSMRMTRTEYRSSDLPLAVVLSTEGFSLIDVDRSGKRAAFVFVDDGSGRLQETVEMYLRRELRVEPQLFHAHTRLVKGRLYAESV